MGDIYAYRQEFELRDDPWDDDVFAEIEGQGGVLLNAEQRRAIQAYVEDYETDLRRDKAIDDSASKDRKTADDLLKSLKEVIRALKASGYVGKIVFWRAGLDPDEVITRLESFQQHCADVRSELAKAGRKGNTFLPVILGQLESVFRSAGGSVGLSKGTDRRESRFIDFAWAVFDQIPLEMRPPSDQALAAAWERIRWERKNPNPQNSV